ncbi:MAG: succinylglutamate desuccinylase/aspartoacylase family protein, partial [Planctomycetes bacterium]|nr:succinylglutamate desuccinylase/aspartoacylase family protein [Planctomycetota bacterium]
MGRPGPTLLVLAGVHGNEPAGVAAVQRVLDTLQQRELAVRGRLVAFAGNLRALAEGRRFVDRDLNRGWSRGAVQELAARRRAAGAAEDHEQRELL